MIQAQDSELEEQALVRDLFEVRGFALLLRHKPRRAMPLILCLLRSWSNRR